MVAKSPQNTAPPAAARPLVAAPLLSPRAGRTARNPVLVRGPLPAPTSRNRPLRLQPLRQNLTTSTKNSPRLSKPLAASIRPRLVTTTSVTTTTRRTRLTAGNQHGTKYIFP